METPQSCKGLLFFNKFNLNKKYNTVYLFVIQINKQYYDCYIF